jgi:hypothetical protein
MPVAAVPSQPRGLNTKYCSYLSGAYFCDETLEAGPLDVATPGPAEIFIDRVNVAET